MSTNDATPSDTHYGTIEGLRAIADRRGHTCHGGSPATRARATPEYTTDRS